MKRSRLWLLAAVPLLAACGGGDTGGGEGGAADTTATTTAPPAVPDTLATQAQGAAMGGDTALTDPGVAAVLAASDQAEIQPSQLAVDRAQNEQVREYARMMVREHTMLTDSLRALAGRLGVTPQENAMSRMLVTQTDSVRGSLQGLSGAGFDQAYVRWMVQSHQTTLAALDSRLIPATQNPEMRTALQQKVRPKVAEHLQGIQRIQSTLGAR